MVKLDTNAAWKEASAIVSANREVLFALAGVFFLVPSLALAVIAGEPEVLPGMRREQMVAAMEAFYAKSWWIVLISAVLQIVGLLAILTLMRDRSRPTVGEAIRGALPGALSYLAAQLAVVIGLSLVGGILIGVAAVISPVLAVVSALLFMAALVFVVFRLILVGPVIAVEGVRNPVVAMVRSWRLTQGNFLADFRIYAVDHHPVRGGRRDHHDDRRAGFGAGQLGRASTDHRRGVLQRAGSGGRGLFRRDTCCHAPAAWRSGNGGFKRDVRVI